MKKILFISTAPTQFKSLLNYALILKDKFEIAFFFDDSQNSIVNEINLSKKYEITYFLYSGSKYYIEQKSVINKNKNYSIPLVIKLASRLIPKSRITNTLYEFLEQEKEVNQLLNYFRPQLIISAEDNFGIITVFNKLVKKRGIKSIVCVFTLANQEELGYVFSKIENNIIKTNGKLLFYYLFGKWKLIYNNTVICCEVPIKIISKELLKIAPYNPWIPVGGKSNIILMESDFVKDYYINSGANIKKIKLLPHPSLKKMQNRLKFKEDYITELKKTYTSISDNPIVLCSFPPDYVENELFENYDEIMSYWLTTLTNQNSHQIWISLHPRSKLNEIFFRKYNVTILTEPIEDLIPLCDSFVAQISATIRLALMCGKPVLNFDMFNTNYSEYKKSELVNTVYTKEDFEKGFIKLLIQNKNIKTNSRYYGNYNTDSTKEILNFFQSI